MTNVMVAQPMLNATKFDSCPLIECRAVTLPVRKRKRAKLGCVC